PPRAPRGVLARSGAALRARDPGPRHPRRRGASLLLRLPPRLRRGDLPPLGGLLRPRPRSRRPHAHRRRDGPPPAPALPGGGARAPESLVQGARRRDRSLLRAPRRPELPLRDRLGPAPVAAGELARRLSLVQRRPRSSRARRRERP